MLKLNQNSTFFLPLRSNLPQGMVGNTRNPKISPMLKDQMAQYFQLKFGGNGQ